MIRNGNERWAAAAAAAAAKSKKKETKQRDLWLEGRHPSVWEAD